SDAISFFSRFRDPFFTQPIDRFFHISVCFHQCFFAVHHASACFFAQFFHHLCSNSHSHSSYLKKGDKGLFPFTTLYFYYQFLFILNRCLFGFVLAFFNCFSRFRLFFLCSAILAAFFSLLRFQNRIRHFASEQFNSSNRIVVAWNDVIDLIWVTVRIDDSNDRDA